MADVDNDNSGELSSFLHLTGWRPLILALVAGLAGAVGLFGALSAPEEYQARYVLNASRVADDDLIPAELDIFVEEIAQTAKLPTVINAVEDRTGLVHEEDYEITVNQSPSSVATIDINVVSENPTDAKNVAIETGIEALTITLEGTLGGLNAGQEQLQSALDQLDARDAELRVEAGGLNPTTAYDIATGALVTRREYILNPDTETTTDANGVETTRVIPPPEPPLEVLEAELNRLEPLDREYRQLVAEIDALSVRLSERNNDVRDATAALDSIETEREQPLIMSEVETEATSRIAALLTGLLLFAVPAALLTILGFTIWDFFRKKPAQVLRQGTEFEAAGVLEAQAKRALPEANFTPLVVVDEDEAENDVLASGDASVANDQPSSSGDDETTTTKRSKDGRWGRDASSKAG